MRAPRTLLLLACWLALAGLALGCSTPGPAAPTADPATTPAAAATTPEPPRPAPSVTSRARPAPGKVVAPPTETPTATPMPQPTRKPTATAVPTHPPVAAPARLLIPRIEVDAPVIELGLTASRAVEDPPGPDVVGWYRLGPRPGEAGNSFITGHVDWKTRTAVFWRLRELQAGDEITVVAADGQRYVFVVEETGSYPAASLKVEQVMGYTVGTVLTLFTCAGTFDQATQDYDHRLVVRARER